MKKYLLIAAFAILASCNYAYAQSNVNRIYRPCPATTTKAVVEIQKDGDINLVPCSGKEVLLNGSSSVTFSGSTRTNYFPWFTTNTNLGKSPFSWSGTQYSLNNTAEDATFKFLFTPATDGTGFVRLGNPSTSYFQINESSAAVLQTPLLMLDTVSDYNLKRTITASGTTGNQTINKPAGSVNFAAAATQVSVTNSIVTANSIIIITQNNTNASPDSACIDFNVSAVTAGSFKIVTPVACNAETRVSFLVFN